MKKYKVIKEFGCALKGDIFVENEEGDFELTVVSDCDDMYSSRVMCISSSIADTLVSNKNLVELEDSVEYGNDEEGIVEKLNNFVDEKIEQYKGDHEELVKQYNEGEVPHCVKVEADTVYFNLNKLLGTIKDIINNK